MITPQQALVRLTSTTKRLEDGITLKHMEEPLPYSVSFEELSLRQYVGKGSLYNGYLLLRYTWREDDAEEHEEDLMFIGVKSTHWAEICADRTVMNRFLNRLVKQIGRNFDISVLSFKFKAYYGLSCDRIGLLRKVRHKYRTEALFDLTHATNDIPSKIHDFSLFIPKDVCISRSRKFVDYIRQYMLTCTRWEDV